MCRIPKLFLVFLFFIIQAQSQQHVGRWKSFTDMKSVRSAVLVGNSIWAATGGGVFVYDTTNGSFSKFTNIDGLKTNDVQAIAFDGTQYVWVGSADGWLNVYDTNTHQWQTIADIANRTGSTYKGIQSFSFKGDTVFIVSEFGVSVFRQSRWEFGDTYQNFGFISPQVSCMTLQQNRIWVGTDKGLAVTTLGSSAWNTYNLFPGITSSAITTLAIFNDTLIIGTMSGAVFFALNDITPKAIPLMRNRSISEIRVVNGKLYVLSASGSSFNVEALTSVLDVPQTVTSNSDVQGVCIIPSSTLWIGTASKGLAHLIGSSWNYSYPNGPNSNFFSSLAVDADGVLWCASGEIAHAGFYRYNPSLPDDSQWKNFTSDKYPIMKKSGSPFDDYYNISLGTGSVWVSSWGDGVVKVVGDSVNRKYNYYSSPSLPGAGCVNCPLDYVVTSGVTTDSDGKVWIVNRNEATGRSLLRLDNDTTGTPFKNQISSSWGRFHGIVIDQNDTKWLGGTVPWHMDPGSGLYFFNEKKKITGIERDSGWGNISNMSDSKVLSIALDLEGALWVGLGLGVVIIPDPLNPTYRNIAFPLREQVVQSITVDGVNNKWVGTKEGVFVVNADGTQLIGEPYTVTSTNKQLLSNDVRTIAIDQKRGIAYFGTEQGLSSLSIKAMQTSRSYSELEVGPNPFILQNNDQQLTIRNLVANSTIKILTVSGSVVKQFEAQGGGRAFWDGRDKNGTFVSSGIYFIVASAENGSQTVTGKVAVIRK